MAVFDPRIPTSPEAPHAPPRVAHPAARVPLFPTLRVAGASFLAMALVVAALSFAPADSALGADSGDSGTPLVLAASPSSAPQAERALIQAHLAEVDGALRAAPTDHLNAGQRANRAALLDELRAYRMAGAFPRNSEVAGRSPVFVDEDGVHCAVGYLIHRSGEDDLVAAVATSRNHARVFDLVDEPAFVAWLESSGLSPVEAAWIQPAYCNMESRGDTFVHGPCPPWPNPGHEELSREYLGLTVGTSTLGAALAAVNLLDLGAGRPSAGRGLFGMGVGAAGVGIGAAGILDGGDARRVGWVNVAFGVLGVSSGAWTFHQARILEAEGAAVRPTVAGGPTASTLSIRPWVPAGQPGAHPESVGVSVRISH